jgi:hypothetical protein
VAAEHFAIDIAAAPERVWQVIVDIESWPQWTKSVTDVKRLDSGPLQVGSRARLKQPGLPPLTWELTELQQGAQFTWACRPPGVTATARHEIIASETGSRLELTTTWTGPLAGLVAALNRTRTHRLLETEANGAKARGERALCVDVPGEQRDENLGVGAAPAGDRVPAGRGPVAGDRLGQVCAWRFRPLPTGPRATARRG